MGKKISEVKTDGVTSVEDSHPQRVKEGAVATDKVERDTGASALKPKKTKAEKPANRKNAQHDSVASLKSGLAEAQHQLAEIQKEAKKTQSKFKSKLKALQAEMESLISDLDSARTEVAEMKAREDAMNARVIALEVDLASTHRNTEQAYGEGKEVKLQPSAEFDSVQTQTEPVLSLCVEDKAAVEAPEEQTESPMKATDAQLEKQVSVKTEEQVSRPPIVGFEAPVPLETGAPPAETEQQQFRPTTVEVEAAVFPKVTDRVVFATALSDIASPEADMRAAGARAIAGIQHELSIRTLVSQLVTEPSVDVRKECVKALTTLEMEEGLAAVERALTDTAASVRLAAVWGLYRLGGAKSTPALLKMFSDENEEVRRRAITCVGWLNQIQTAGKVTKNLHSRQIVSTLIAQLNDPAESVRNAAVAALETVTGKKMDNSSAADEKSREHLMTRWHKWWMAKLL